MVSFDGSLQKAPAGSAPVDAVYEFINMLAPGARAIRIGSGFQLGAA
jgi:hypothetical protein